MYSIAYLLRIDKRYSEIFGERKYEIAGNFVYIFSNPGSVLIVVVIADFDENSRCPRTSELCERCVWYHSHEIRIWIYRLEVIRKYVSRSLDCFAVRVVVDIRSHKHSAQILRRGVGMKGEMKVVVSRI